MAPPPLPLQHLEPFLRLQADVTQSTPPSSLLRDASEFDVTSLSSSLLSDSLGSRTPITSSASRSSDERSEDAIASGISQSAEGSRGVADGLDLAQDDRVGGSSSSSGAENSSNAESPGKPVVRPGLNLRPPQPAPLSSVGGSNAPVEGGEGDNANNNTNTTGKGVVPAPVEDTTTLTTTDKPRLSFKFFRTGGAHDFDLTLHRRTEGVSDSDDAETLDERADRVDGSDSLSGSTFIASTTTGSSTPANVPESKANESGSNPINIVTSRDDFSNMHSNPAHTKIPLVARPFSHLSVWAYVAFALIMLLLTSVAGYWLYRCCARARKNAELAGTRRSSSAWMSSSRVKDGVAGNEEKAGGGLKDLRLKEKLIGKNIRGNAVARMHGFRVGAGGVGDRAKTQGGKVIELKSLSSTRRLKSESKETILSAGTSNSSYSMATGKDRVSSLGSNASTDLSFGALKSPPLAHESHDKSPVYIPTTAPSPQPSPMQEYKKRMRAGHKPNRSQASNHSRSGSNLSVSPSYSNSAPPSPSPSGCLSASGSKELPRTPGMSVSEQHNSWTSSYIDSKLSTEAVNASLNTTGTSVYLSANSSDGSGHSNGAQVVLKNSHPEVLPLSERGPTPTTPNGKRIRLLAGDAKRPEIAVTQAGKENKSPIAERPGPGYF